MKEIKWSKTALHQLDKALDFIIQEGFAQYAVELEAKILSRIDNLIVNHDVYTLDKYKKTMMALTTLSRLMNTVSPIVLKQKK